jgi:hypothetical protein
MIRKGAGIRWMLVLAALLALGVSLGAPGAAQAHKGSPSYRSTLRSISPPQPGIQVQVLNYDDRLQLINRSGRTVVVRGYDGEPYVRVLGDGTVEVNKNSPSFYLNQDRYGDVTVPSTASKNAAPAWNLVDRTGRYEWHDHRIHYMAKGLPPQVKNRNKRARIFGWQVPVEVGGQPANLRGDLYWQPQTGGLPRGALIAFAVLVFGSVFIVEYVRRRRRRDTIRPRTGKAAWG